MSPKKEEPTASFDLDAALEEKFQSAQQAADQLREMRHATANPSSQATSIPSDQIDDVISNPISDTPEKTMPPVIEMVSSPADEKKNGKEKETDPELKKARQARRKLRRQLLITNRIGAVLRIFSIGTVLFAGSIFFLVGTRPTESAEENRKLATIPSFSWDSFANGTYIADWITYYEDTVPGRSTFKRLISQLESLQGLQGEEQVQFYGNVSQILPVEDAQNAQLDAEAAAVTTTVPVATETNTNTSTTAVSTLPTVTTTSEPEAEPVDIGDGIVLVDKRAISVYGGSFSRGEAYAACLNAYKQALGENVQVYSLVAPTAVSFYLPDSYAGYTGSEIENIEHIGEALQDVLAVDAYSALEAHQDEDIYARTDHHWTPLGAYYAAEAFAETADVPFASLRSYTRTTLSGYLGSMYTFTKSAVLQENPEDFTYYSPRNTYTTHYYDTNFTNEREGNLLISLDNVEPVSWYLVFMGGDEKITHVTTDVSNDRTLVIVKDSYGNALVPYLTQSFSEIYVIDMRYFELNAVDFMKQVGATDVLFAMNTFSATGTNSTYLETIRTQ